MNNLPTQLNSCNLLMNNNGSTTIDNLTTTCNIVMAAQGVGFVYIHNSR